MIQICQANKRRHEKRKKQLAAADGGLLPWAKSKSVSQYCMEKKAPIGKG